MRVVHVVHAFGTGGMEKGVGTIVRHASPDIAHAVVCLTVGGASERLLPDETPVVELHKPPGHSIRFLGRIARALRDLRPDVVHTRNWGGFDGVVAARFAGIRSVVHGEHGWTMDDPHGANRRRLRARRFLGRWVREFTCVSRGIERWLRDDVRVRRPVTQIYNGVDTARFRPRAAEDRAAVRARLGIGPDGFVATICGRLDPIKDHDTLFLAFRRIHRRQASARLLVIGDGPERARLEGLAGPGVLLLGERGDVPELLGASDLFTLTSRNEGISNTILEAMASGLPVVATRVGGNTELLEDGVSGTLVAPGNEEALDAAIEAYRVSHGLRVAHGSAGRTRVEREFGLERMVAAYESVYRRVAASRARQSEGTPA